MCSHIIRENGVIAVTSFLNNDGSLFRLLFRDRRVGGKTKSRGRRVNGGNLSLTILKVQDDGGYYILEWSRMA